MGVIYRYIKLNEDSRYLDLYLHLLKNAKSVSAPLPINQSNEDEDERVVGWYTMYEFDDLEVHESYFTGEIFNCVFQEKMTSFYWK